MARRKERRKFPRRDCLIRCRCEDEGLRFDGYIVDISYGGAGIIGTKKLPSQGSTSLVTIRLPWKMIELRSRVEWVKADKKGPGLADFGVEFLDSPQVRQDKLAAFFPQSSAVGD